MARRKIKNPKQKNQFDRFIDEKNQFFVHVDDFFLDDVNIVDNLKSLTKAFLKNLNNRKTSISKKTFFEINEMFSFRQYDYFFFRVFSEVAMPFII